MLIISYHVLQKSWTLFNRLGLADGNQNTQPEVRRNSPVQLCSSAWWSYIQNGPSIIPLFIHLSYGFEIKFGT